MSSIKPGKKYFSVVFEVQDPEVFKDMATKLSSIMAQESCDQGAKVTACGWGDYATERDAYAQELQDDGKDPDMVVSNFLAVELGEIGSFPEGQDFRDEVRNVTG